MTAPATIEFIDFESLCLVVRSSCSDLLPGIETSLARVDSTYVYLHSRLLLFLWKAPGTDRLLKCSMSITKVDFDSWQVKVDCPQLTDPKVRKAFFADVLDAFGEPGFTGRYSSKAYSPSSEALKASSLQPSYGGISLLPQLSYLIA